MPVVSFKCFLGFTDIEISWKPNFCGKFIIKNNCIKTKRQRRPCPYKYVRHFFKNTCTAQQNHPQHPQYRMQNMTQGSNLPQMGSNMGHRQMPVSTNQGQNMDTNMNNPMYMNPMINNRMQNHQNPQMGQQMPPRAQMPAQHNMPYSQERTTFSKNAF